MVNRMRKTTIILLQIISLLLMISNHFITTLFSIKYVEYYFFGFHCDMFLRDLIFFLGIILQLFIIIILMEGKNGNTKYK